MKLRVFTKETQEEWIREGYDSVKITTSGHLSVNEVSDKPFMLLEPYKSAIDIGDGDLVQSIASPAILQIIEKENGKCYQ